MKYIEKHVGTGKGEGIRSIDPVTECHLQAGAVLEMDTSPAPSVSASPCRFPATQGDSPPCPAFSTRTRSPRTGFQQ